MKNFHLLYSIWIYLIIILFNHFYLKVQWHFLCGYIHIDHHSFTSSDLTIYTHGTNYFIQWHQNNILIEISDPDRACCDEMSASNQWSDGPSNNMYRWTPYNPYPSVDGSRYGLSEAISLRDRFGGKIWIRWQPKPMGYGLLRELWVKGFNSKDVEVWYYNHPSVDGPRYGLSEDRFWEVDIWIRWRPKPMGYGLDGLWVMRGSYISMCLIT